MVLVVVMLLAGCAQAGGGTGPTDPGGGPLNPAGIPAGFVPLLLKTGGRYCPLVTAPALAGQDRQESGWDPTARSAAGAEGLAQFMPGTWATWGRDADGNGTSSPLDPGDAIDAQGRFMCSLVAQMSAAKRAGRVSGDVLQLAWAGYNAGPGAVLAAGGIPPLTETINYVRAVQGYMVGYESGGGPAGGSGRFVNPLAGEHYVLTSGFGPRPSPCRGCSSFHYGQDMAVSVGTPVHAACSGVVIASADPLGGMGLATVIACGGGVRMYYGHQSQSRVSPGTRVTAGQLIGLSGNTGHSSGPHLHFEIHVHSPVGAGGGWYAGTPVNPVPFMSRHGAPL